MREPWSFPIPQAMQQHGGVSKATAKGRELTKDAIKRPAEPTPREVDAKERQAIKPKRNS